MAADSDKLTFWEHLDDLRAVLIRMLIAIGACSVVAFFFKEQLFDIVLAPKNSDFVTYRLIDRLASLTGSETEPFDVELINTGLAQQFIIHMKTALSAGFICASPYIVYQLFGFIAPALYMNERRYAVRVAGGGYVMFFIGVLLCYFIIFPLTFRFLGTYSVSGEISNLISIESYISTLMLLCITMGIVFEIPIVSWLLAKLGIIDAAAMSKYRKHSIVAILAAAAVITPTSDIFTLLIVALPIWLLYEFSIVIVKRAAPASC